MLFQQLRQNAAPDVQLLDVPVELAGGHVAPRAVVDAEGERLPVGQVDHALVLDRLAPDLGGQSVEHARGVRAGVVHAVGP